MTENLVSIIMPAYKTETFIGEAIQSVLNQTYPHWELLITDDCSPDNLKSVVMEFTQKDARVKYFLASKNGGPARARNNSLEHAKGRFIAFLDSDDLWLPAKLEIQLRFMLSNCVAFSYSDYIRIKADGTPYPFINHVPTEVSYSDLLKNTSIATLTVILDRSKIPDTKMTPDWGYDDYILWLEILKKGIKARAINECLAKYRVMETSVSSNKPRSLKWVWNIYFKHQRLGLMRSLFYIFNFSLNAFLKRTNLFNKNFQQIEAEK